MPSKHFNKILLHTCTVQRATETQSGSGENIKTFSTLATGVVCRLVRNIQRFAAEGDSEERIRTDTVLIKATQDVEPGDQLTAFLWASDSSSYDTGTYVVLNRLQRNTTSAHHISLEVEKVG